MVIKSGSNALHGSLYYFNRNDALAANTPFRAPQAQTEEQSVRRLRRRPHRQGQAVLLPYLRAPEIHCGQRNRRNGTVRGMGFLGHRRTPAVQRSGEFRDAERAFLLAGARTHWPGDLPELLQHRR